MASPRLSTASESPIPSPVAVGGGSGVFLDGRCLLDGAPPASLHLLVGDRVVEPLGWGAPSPRSRSGHDYWWAVVPLEPVEGPTTVTLTLRASDSHRRMAESRVGELELVPGLEEPDVGDRVEMALAAAGGVGRGEGEPLVAICMASFEPDPELLRRQIDSIRGQTHGRWICLISDDGSSARGSDAIQREIRGDPRFVLSTAPVNRGFYANFERALSMVPPEADLVALSDQDDEWRPEKLEALIEGLEPDAQLVYSDMRIVTEDGEVISDTYWQYRRNNHTDFSSLVLANTVTGAASLFRRELLDDVLPFPPRHARAYHDHWIAQVAMALGPISYVDQPLYDYVQHGGAAIGHLEANGEGRFSASLAGRARITWRRFRGRRYHLGWRQPYFNIYCRLFLAATVLRARLGDRIDPGKLAVIETLLDRRRARSWLARRVATDGFATTETLGRERVILAGLAWDSVRRRSRERLIRRGRASV